ncbi:transcriptional regulator [Saccharomonospora marina XMU15]|uniref:Transcriptional regulator n=2 Tax=Saccharomonospora TaxID=1851 RepID=H5WY39_9PSEU|nr:transcriptional regulator [Saccharomonospora marina XMU15]
MSVAKPRRMSRQARRQDLVAAALELFSTRAPEDVGIDDVTARAGVSRPLFYRYFRGLDELRVAALRTVADDLLDRMRRRASGSRQQRLRAVVRALVDVAAEHRCGYLALLRSGSVVATSETNAIVDEVRARAVEVVLAECEITEPSPMLLATLRCWTAIVEVAVSTWLQGAELRRERLDGWLVDQLMVMLQVTARHDDERGRRGASAVGQETLTTSSQPSTCSGPRGAGPT